MSKHHRDGLPRDPEGWPDGTVYVTNGYIYRVGGEYPDTVIGAPPPEAFDEEDRP